MRKRVTHCDVWLILRNGGKLGNPLTDRDRSFSFLRYRVEENNINKLPPNKDEGY